MRIGDVALLAGDGERAGERAAAADLDHVAERFAARGLAEQAVIEFLPALGRPFQQLLRAVHARPFLVAGNEQRDRAFDLAAVLREVLEHGGNEGGDRALHVDRAAAVEMAVGELPGKRPEPPGIGIARGHHVGVAGEDEMRRREPDARVEVLDVRRAFLGERHAIDGKARRLEHARQHRKRAAFGRRHRAAADQFARERDRVLLEGGGDRVVGGLRHVNPSAIH